VHRPIRTAISVLAVAIDVGMVTLVVGLCHGFVHDKAKRVEGVGADILVQPLRSSFLMGMTQAPMPIKIGDRVAEVPHVLAVAPALFLVNAVGSLTVIYGIDMAS
jgi:putative ABC transport system permease protein